ncbi:MAG: glycosyltransferase, partial [Acidobacteriota bacterium]|nr:glycosyltransferase [Acidobacteriota bacterium]
MARILISTFGSFGDVNPYVGLALELGHRGHHPVLAMPGVYREVVEREGLAFRAIRPDVDIDDHALIARMMDASRGTEAIFGEWIVPNLQASYDDLRAAAADADLLITHPASLVGPIVAEA